MLREIDRALAVIEQFPQYVGCTGDRGRVRRLGARALGHLRQRELCLPQQRVLPGVPGQADEEGARPQRADTAKVHEATTWSFSMEGERYFEGTRSFVTASGIEKPLMNAYRAFAHLGDRPPGRCFGSVCRHLRHQCPGQRTARGGRRHRESQLHRRQRRDCWSGGTRTISTPRTPARLTSTSRWTDSTAVSGPCSTTGSTTATATVTPSGRPRAHRRTRPQSSWPRSPPGKVSRSSPMMPQLHGRRRVRPSNSICPLPSLSLVVLTKVA